MEFFTPREEVARRERLAISLSRIDDLMPQEDYVCAQKYISYSLAPRIRLASYNNDAIAQNILANIPTIQDACNMRMVFADLTKNESLLLVSKDDRDVIGFYYDSRKFKVNEINVDTQRNIEKPDELFENFLKIVEQDLLKGRKAWAEILRKRRQEYFQGNEVGRDDLEMEIQTLIRWTSGRNEELVLFGADAKKEEEKEVIDVYSTFDFSDHRAMGNLLANYDAVRGIEPKFYDDQLDRETFEVDFGNFIMRMRRAPSLKSSEALNLVEEGFGEFITGKGDFGYKIRGVGPVTLLGLDPIYEKLIFPVFGEVKAED